MRYVRRQQLKRSILRTLTWIWRIVLSLWLALLIAVLFLNISYYLNGGK